MRRMVGCLSAVVLLLSACGQADADVIITYQNVGANLQFNYSGSLNVSTGPGFNNAYATVSNQGGSPVFYSSTFEAYAASDFSVTHTPGAFATNLPAFVGPNPIEGPRSGSSFLFRVNNAIPGPATSVDLWGDWGSANAPINGQLTLLGQSAAGIGMVDGWSLQTDWGSITFQAANMSAVPEPSGFLAVGIAGLLTRLAVRRKQKNRERAA